MVSTPYPGAAPEEVESEVTQVVEDAVATVAGIDELRSISREGQSMVIITFRIDRDLDAGAQDIRDAVSGVRNRMPPDIDPPVISKRDTDSSPVITLAVSGAREPRELYVLAEKNVKNVIESAPGVGEALIVGAADRAMRVEIEAERLAAFGLSIVEVREALARQNVETPAGRVDAGRQELGLRTLGRLDSAAEFEMLTVATVNGAPVRIRDLGRVVDGAKEVRTLSRLNGQTAVVVQVQRQSGANTVATIEAVKERLERSRELLPADVEVTVLQDQSRYIGAALHEVQKHLVAGSILASIVVLLFMRSWRSTLIAAVAIPTSIIATFAAMRWMNFTLNNVTMLALVLMVGVVIDDAIVVLENIFRSMEEKKMPPLTAAVQGTKEIGLAVLATTLSLVIVFLPVSFLSSVTGRMLFEFGVTATVAIMVSMLISFSLTPMMCSRLLRVRRQAAASEPNDQHAAGAAEPESRRGFYHWIDAGYAWCLGLSMRWRWAVLLISLATIALNVPLYNLVKQDYIPTNVDESEFEVSVTAPEGATLRSMDQVLQTVETDLRKVRGVTLLLTSVGTRGGGGVNSGQIYVRIEDIGERTFSWGRLARETFAGRPLAAFEGNYSQRDVMDDVRSLLGKYEDLDIGVRNQTSLRQGAPVDIDFVVQGPDLQQLAEVGERLRARFDEIPGVVDTYTTLKLEKPELLASIDRRRAAALGVDVREIAETLRIAVGGDDRVSRYRDRSLDDAYDVELRLVGVDRGSAEKISQLYVRTRSGPTGRTAFTQVASSREGPAGAQSAEMLAGVPRGVTRLDNLVTFSTRANAARIDRMDRRRMVAVRANVDSGYALADRIAAIQQATDEMGLPPGFETSVRGRGRELETTFRDMAWMFVLSLVFMYIVLAAQFEHLLHPITILVTLPLATPFGLLSLWIGDETLNLYSALGILVLFGVVKKAAILQVDHTNQLRAAGLDRHTAIMQANRDRLRPILMTTIAFVAGMLPLLFGSGPGAEERRSIAVLAVGGQTLSLLLTLLAAPVVYSYLDDLANLGKRFALKRFSRLNSF
jgi:HAE1 family hydrophobic/amphiphilic exporter-1